MTKTDMNPSRELLDQINAEITKDLVTTAIQSIQYVALGKCMARDLVEKHGITLEQAEYQLAVVSDVLCRKIRPLTVK